MYLPNEVCANKLTLCSELMIFIGYKNNGYRFICHTQENVIFHSTQAIFDEEHFPKCPSFHSKEQIPTSRLTSKIELSALRSFGVDKPALISFPLIPVYPRPSTLLISPNLPTHSKSPSLSLSLTPPKQFSVKIEEIEDEDIEMHFLSPPPLEAGPL